MLACVAVKVLAEQTCTSLPASDHHVVRLQSLEKHTWAQHDIQCHQVPGSPRFSGQESLPSKIILEGKVRRNPRFCRHRLGSVCL